MLGKRVVNNILGIKPIADKRSKNSLRYVYQSREESRENNERERARIKKNEDIMNSAHKNLDREKFYGYNIINKSSQHAAQSSITDNEVQSIIQNANMYDIKKENELYLEQYKSKNKIDK